MTNQYQRYSWHAHPAKRKSIGLTLGPRGKGGTEKNRFREGKRPIIIGTEQLNYTLGSRNFSCSFKKELVFLPGNGLQTTMDKHKQEICIKCFPSSGKKSRSTKFTKWVIEHNTYPKILPKSGLSFSEIASIVISRNNV